MKHAPVAFALLFALAVPSAFAAETAATGESMKCPMHDTSLTDAERAQAMDKMFAKLDADGDGSISRAEFDRHHEDMRRKHAEDAKAGEHADHAAHEEKAAD